METICGWQWSDYDILSSTNDKAKDMSKNASAERFVVTAKQQTKGRGRRGRQWISREGNLFMSLALPLPIAKAGELIFVVSLALLETIRQMKPNIDINLKWPNDVLVNGGKISGILLEKAEGEYIIIGIGVNIVASPKLDGNLLYQAQSLSDAGVAADRISFMKAYLLQFNRNFSLWQEEGFAPLQEQWLKNACRLNETIQVRTEKNVREGIFRGVDDQGMLLLEEQGIINKIYAGDVFF